MKKIILFLIIVSCAYSCKNNKSEIDKNQSYIINGVVKDVQNGELYIQVLNTAEPKPDTIKILNGKFNYTGKSIAPELAIIVLAASDKKINGKNIVMFFNEPGSTINITIDSAAKEKFDITGSKTNDEFKQFKANNLERIEEKEKKAFENVNPMNISNPKTMDSLMKLAQDIQQEKKDAIINYITAHKNSIVGVAYAYLLSSQESDTKFIQSAYNAANSSVQNSFYGTEIKKKIDAVSKTDIGAAAADFTTNDEDGKLIKLSDFYKGKKLVLIDFWASWCGPCRKENPNVVKAYNKFHSKGFEVLGVSLDEDKKDWKDAIKRDNLTWMQVSDLKGWESQIARLYNVTAIPTNFLIDGNGKIIATNLRGEELEIKLAQLLK